MRPPKKDRVFGAIKKPQAPISVTFAVMTPILLFTKGLRWCASAKSMGVADIIVQEVPGTWRWVRARMGMKSWSCQKPCCVSQIPAVAARPQIFAFHLSSAALHCNGNGRFWPLGRRRGECRCSSLISVIKQGIVAGSSPLHLTFSGKIKWFWSSVRIVRDSQQAITNTMRRFSLGQPIWPSDQLMGTRQPIPWKGKTMPLPSCGSLCKCLQQHPAYSNSVWWYEILNKWKC